MKTYRDIQQTQLIDLIGAGSADGSDPGPVVVEAFLADSQKVIRATYYRGDKKPDVATREEIFLDDEVLRPFVEALVQEGKIFVTETGCSDTVCQLEWTIEDAA